MRIRIRIILAVILIAVLAFAAFWMIRLVTAAAGSFDSIPGEPDPMFSQPPELVTRPPELDAEEMQVDHPTLDDYVPENETPVDKTAAELIAEAKQAE